MKKRGRNGPHTDSGRAPLGNVPGARPSQTQEPETASATSIKTYQARRRYQAAEVIGKPL